MRPRPGIAKCKFVSLVIGKVDGFAPEQAERLEQWIAKDTGADPAATDSARALRLPGFYNHKYEKPHFVSVETLSDGIRRPNDFPAPDRNHASAAGPGKGTRRVISRGTLSRSEKDWAYAKRALARGDCEELVIAAIATQRRYDKHSPQGYAEMTVRKAAQSLSIEQVGVQRSGPDR